MATKPPTRDERRDEARRLLEGLNGAWVATRMGVGEATVSAWRRGDRTPDLGDLLALAIAVGRPLDRELDARVLALLESGRVYVSAVPAVIDAAALEADRVVEEQGPRRGRGASRPAGDGGGDARRTSKAETG